MQCPRCASPLTTHSTTVALLQGCLACGGIFVDRESRIRMIQTVDAAVCAASDLAAAHARWAPDTAARISCPCCRGSMTVTRVAAGGVDIDVCDAHGAWFDRHELRKFLDALVAQRSSMGSSKKQSAKNKKRVSAPVPEPGRDSAPPSSSSGSDALGTAGDVFDVIGAVFEIVGAFAD